MINKLYRDCQALKSRGNGNWKYLYKINKLIVNIFYPFVASLNNKKGVDKNSDVIVSLTTYPARIKTVWITIASLLNQTYKPKVVVLYLAEEQFPNGFEELPRKLLKLQKRGLEIVFVEDDLKPHKKYYYAFKEYKNDYVITADDDIFYPENHIEEFIRASIEHPDAVICKRSHKIGFVEKDGEVIGFSPYNTWVDNKTEKPDIVTLPVGCNGVLYKPDMFDDEIFNIVNIKKHSLYTDDLWLKAMEIKCGILAYNCSDEPLVYFDNIFTANTGLWHKNTGDDNRNDLAWVRLVEIYPELNIRLNIYE